MYPKLKPMVAALTALSVCPLSVIATEDIEPIVVTASSIAQKETEATFATEIHTRKMIEKTGAGSLYEYLSQYASLNIMPAYGNKAAPMLDMRGYGIGSGYQNIALNVDGRRLNNVDMSSPLLAAILLADVERIEIVKGSGSVMQGDGAMAGSVQIITRPRDGVILESSLGNFGTTQNNLAVGFSQAVFGMHFSANTESNDGTRHRDATGHKDNAAQGSQKLNTYVQLSESVKVNLEVGHTDVDTRYGGSITQAQFEQNPAQTRSTTQRFTHQKFATDHWRVGAQIAASNNLQISLNTGSEQKRSDYVTSTLSDYLQTQHDLGAIYCNDSWSVSAGVQNFRGVVDQDGAKTSKENTGVYLLGQYEFSPTTSLTAGTRHEAVSYTSEVSNLSRSKNLNAWDLGINHRLSSRYTSFVNYNQAFQAPDVDRFFSTIYDNNWNAIGRQFNGFIEPAHVKTLTLGLNRLTETSKTKAALFYARLENEIYLEPITYKNTNIDKSHKYGLELQQFWKVGERLNLNLNYSQIRAVIAEENEHNGAYNGKDLPGVPRHNVLASAIYALTSKTTILASQMWRDQAYAANDFTNSFKHRQGIQASTNLGIRHQFDKSLEFIASAENVFGHKNGIWIRDDAIYPTSFAPLYKVGLKARF